MFLIHAEAIVHSVNEWPVLSVKNVALEGHDLLKSQSVTGRCGHASPSDRTNVAFYSEVPHTP